MWHARRVFQWAASACCGCKYSWEGDLAMVPPSLPHIAFAEVKCQTCLKYHWGLQPVCTSGWGQPGSPEGFVLIYGGVWHRAVNRGTHQITSWESCVPFLRAGTPTRGGVGAGTAPGPAACFSPSIKDGKKRAVLPWWLRKKLCLGSSVESLVMSWEIPGVSLFCCSLSKEEGWLMDLRHVL